MQPAWTSLLLAVAAAYMQSGVALALPWCPTSSMPYNRYCSGPAQNCVCSPAAFRPICSISTQKCQTLPSGGCTSLFTSQVGSVAYDEPLTSLVGGDLTHKPAQRSPGSCACGCASDGNCVGYLFTVSGDSYYTEYPGCWWARVTNPLAQPPCTITPAAAPGWNLHIRAALSASLEACRSSGPSGNTDPCTNGQKDANESGIDCGGTSGCGKCANGQGCQGPDDCVSAYCPSQTHVCATDPCTNGQKDANESGIDCGGTSGCGKCANGQGCQGPDDCVSAYCPSQTHVCATNPCTNGQKDANESGVDCGGTSGCGKCANGQGCQGPDDCLSGYCHSNVCDSANAIGWGDSSENLFLTGLIGNHYLTPVPIPGSWSSLVLGVNHACGIKMDYHLWCWGYGYSGQLGQGDADQSTHTTPVQVLSPVSWKMVSLGSEFTCGITSTDACYCWGYNNYGTVGNGEIYTCVYDPTQVSGGGLWKTVSCGGDHSCGIKISAPGETSGYLACWGEGSEGQLGHGGSGSYMFRSAPTQVGSLTGWEAVSAGYFTTCALYNDGEIYCFGRGGTGQRGDGTNAQISQPDPNAPVIRPAGVSGWKSLGTFYEQFVCAISTSDYLFCWGYNGYGQLGDGTTTTSNVPVQVKTDPSTVDKWDFVSCGGGTTCGIKSATKRAACWGKGDSGERGDGTSSYYAASPYPQSVQFDGSLSFVHLQFSTAVALA